MVDVGDPGHRHEDAALPEDLHDQPHHARLLEPALRRTSTTSDTVTVRRGDTLWSIATAHLGSGATDAEVAAEWPHWYEVNRAVIGDDPDLLVPGQQLQAPLAEVLR